MDSQSKKIRISVIKADLCPDREIFTKQHLCCLISFRGNYYKTLSHHFCGNNPVWEEEFSVTMGEDNNVLKFELCNETTRDSLIAHGSVDLADCDEKKWIDLEKDGKFIGKLLVETFPEIEIEQQPTLTKSTSIHDVSHANKRDWMENNPSDSLREYVNHPHFVESRKEDEVKLAGLKNSKSSPAEFTEEKKSVMDSIKGFFGNIVEKEKELVDALVHKEKELVAKMIPSKYKDEPLTNKIDKDVPVTSKSLSDMMSKPVCVECPADKQTKLAGVNMSQSNKSDFDKFESKSDDLTGLLDKASMKETKPEDSTKIAGTHNTSSKLDSYAEKNFLASKESGQNKKFDSKTANQMSGILEKESFDEAAHQDGLKFGGVKNC